MHAILDNVIEGSGGGGKSGSTGGTEQPNTLRSKALAKFVGLLGEGEILGLVDGAKSIIINKIALENADGSTNWKGYKYNLLTGTSDQSHLVGFDDITSEQNVGLRVKNVQPVIYRTQSATLDAVRVTLQIPALTKLDKEKGTLRGYHVSVGVDIKSLSDASNPWVSKVVTDYISGKNTAPYERSYRIALSGQGPWLVRMVRQSPDDDNDSTIASTTIFSHITEISEHKVSYSDSAVIGVEIDADQFGNGIGEREYDIYGIKMQYPSNYNPATRAYSGFWDGTWAYGYCNNPAWFFRWLAINPRFGVGIPDRLVDKWGLYELAKYCDFLVSDGKGGMEPRFQFNGEIREQAEAFKVLQQIASMMRAITFYSSGGVLIRQDAPMAPEQRIFTPANVIGKFKYASTALSVRHNACIVEWINPDLGYESDFEIYEDRADIIKFGYKPLKFKAIGTTSAGQAYRMGKWAILTEQLQKDTISFDVGLDSATVLPGDIIEVADPHKATADFAGRLMQPIEGNIIRRSRISEWTANASSSPGSFAPGPWGDRNLRLIVCNTSSGRHSRDDAQSVPLVMGQTYTYSFFAAPGTTNLVYGRIFTANMSRVHAGFDLGRELVSGVGTGVLRASCKKWKENLYRCEITFVATDDTAAPTVSVGIDRTLTTICLASAANAWTSVGTESAYFGFAQLETSPSAGWPLPAPIPNGSTTVMLDRDIEFTGATSPELHLTLVDGPLDDKPGMDNSGRIGARKLRYFSSPITAYDQERQVVTLANAIPVGGNDQQTPLVWIFAKQQVSPKPYKIITIKENDDRTYSINAIEYSSEKFVKLDEGFVITYDTNKSFSNLPTTSYCAPPVGPLTIDSTSELVNGVMRQNLTLGWGASPDQFLRGYTLAYKEGDENWVVLPMIYENTYVLRDLPPGAYGFVLQAVNKFGVSSEELTNGYNIQSNSVAGRGSIVNVYSDLNNQQFSDKDARLYWISNSLSASPQNAGFTAVVGKGAGAGTSQNSDGYLVTGGTQTVSTASVATNVTNKIAPTFTTSGTWRLGDQFTVNVGQTEFILEFNGSETLTAFTERMRALIDADPRFVATRSSLTVTVTFVDGATNAEAIAAENDPLFKRFRVRIMDQASNAVKRTEYTTNPEYVYAYAKNLADFGSPNRSFKVGIAVEDIYNNISAEKIVTVANPAPAAVPVVFDRTPFTVNPRFVPPNDPDYQGFLMYMSTEANFVAADSNKVYQDRGNPSVPVQPGTKYYVKYGFYDAFGIAGITLSPTVEVETPALTGFDVEELQTQIDFNADSLAEQIILGELRDRLFDFRTLYIDNGTLKPLSTFAAETKAYLNTDVTQAVQAVKLLGASTPDGSAFQFNIDTVQAGYATDGTPITLSQKLESIGGNINGPNGLQGRIDKLDEVVFDKDGGTVRSILRMENNKYISGVYLTNDGTSSAAIFKVSTFGVVSDDGSGSEFYPFTISGNKVKMTNVEVDTLAAGSVTIQGLAIGLTDTIQFTAADVSVPSSETTLIETGQFLLGDDKYGRGLATVAFVHDATQIRDAYCRIRAYVDKGSGYVEVRNFVQGIRTSGSGADTFWAMPVSFPISISSTELVRLKITAQGVQVNGAGNTSGSVIRSITIDILKLGR